MHRCVDEYEDRYDARSLDTIDQMRLVVIVMSGKRLKFEDLAA